MPTARTDSLRLNATGLRSRLHLYSSNEYSAAAQGCPTRAPVVLALHMLGLDGMSFDELAIALGPPWTVIAYDQRGHGAAADQAPRTYADWVADARAVLAQIDADEIHLVGSSLGGTLAGHLAAESGDPRLASLTLIAAPLIGEPVFAQRANAVATGGLDEPVRATLARWFGDTAFPEARARAERALRALTPAGWDACWRAFAEFGGFARLARPGLPPTLCLAFAEDRSTPPATLDQIAALLAAAGTPVERRDLPGLGHAGLLCQPAAIAEALVPHFLRNRKKLHPHP
jgi:3-oxoadipate enol-lactonase